MDKVLHFAFSFAIAYGILSLLGRRHSTKTTPLWLVASVQAGAQRMLLLALGVGAVGATFIGLAKEFRDRLGFGNYEIADMVANSVGIIFAIYLYTKAQKENSSLSGSHKNGSRARPRPRLVRSIGGRVSDSNVRPAREGLRLQVVVTRPKSKEQEGDSGKRKSVPLRRKRR